ncbi:MAG: FG-GAP-like repeat-containing protein [Myxococcales bacterium]|nr:FG-GAP-like repeat-containing protein [Myxococcota bacterium]MDW8284453.1 FG-GAP-like repeat-containing protein [Myxococcales bacterium]
MSKNHPDNCVQNRSICGPQETCNEITEVCEPNGGGPGGSLAIDDIQPRRVPSSSQQGQKREITITGRGFLPSATVHLYEREERIDATVVSSTQIVATVPQSSDVCQPVRVRVNNPDGQFATRSDLFGYSIAKPSFFMENFPLNLVGADGLSHPPFLAIADLDNDGGLDVVTAFSAGGRSAVVVIPRIGHGMPPRYFLGQATFTALAVGQLGYGPSPEIVVAYTQGTTGGVFIFRDGQLSSPLSLPTSHPVTGLALADMNRDGRLDLVLSTGSGSTSVLQVYQNQGNGLSKIAMDDVSIDSCPAPSLAAADLDGDGAPDVALACPNGLVVARNDGAGGLSMNTLRWGSSAFSSLAAADFNGDGRMDLALADNTSISIVRFEAGGLVEKAHETVSSTASPIRIEAADINCDLWPDVVYTKSGTDLGVVLNQGKEGWQLTTLVEGMGSGTPRIAVGDFNNDRRPDVLTSYLAESSSPLFRFWNSGS